MGRLPIDIKKKLGYIIRVERTIKSDKQKSKTNSKDNPYSKENFCKGICHYHTLNKLEKDYVNDSKVYLELLDKLSCSFKVSINEHRVLMNTLNYLLLKLLQAMEYIDDGLLENLINELNTLNYQQDCIAYYYVKLIEVAYNSQILKRINEEELNRIMLMKDLFDDLFQGLYNHVIGLYYMNNLELLLAEEYLTNAKIIYQLHNISKGLINTNFISLYMLKKDYINMVNLCLEMETYYLQTRNIHRLFHVYDTLANYFMLIYSYKKAYNYHINRKELMEKEEPLHRYQYSVNYNWGLSLIVNHRFSDAYEYLLNAYESCPFNNLKLRILNALLFIMVKLNFNEDIIKNYVQQGKTYVNDAIEGDQIIFKYFEFKYENNQYYRKYATTKLLPFMLAEPRRIDFTIMLFEDLYD
ncbi:MAG: hypothetical protein GX490_00855 [Bacilli bacterium]|nr:hypothetical protein [Bacilli bacterium]